MTPARARAWGYLGATVALEILATLMLKASEQFTVPAPSVIATLAYVATVVSLAKALREIPMSVAYVIWTELGTTGVALLSAIVFAQRLSATAWVGVAFVVAGVMMINGGARPDHSRVASNATR